MERVIFLDIDGVLNSTRYWWANKPLPMNQAGAIDPVAVARLNTIIGETGAAVVLSSWWRTNSYPVVQEMLRERGFVGELVGQTPVKLESPRHAEIAEWLGENACERFVVIDDDPDAWHPEMPFADRGHFASTNYMHGLVDEHIPLICSLFGLTVEVQNTEREHLLQQIRDLGWDPRIGKFDPFTGGVTSSALRIGAERPAIFPSPNLVYGQGSTEIASARDLLFSVRRKCEAER